MTLSNKRTRSFDGRWLHNAEPGTEVRTCGMISPSEYHCHGGHGWYDHPNDQNFDLTGVYHTNWWQLCSIPEEQHVRN